jgi:hypothetical protein
MATANIYQKLVAIQNEMAAPKSEKKVIIDRKTGRERTLNYRTLDNINEQLKPILDKHQCSLFFSDDVFSCEGTTFLKTTVTLVDCETGENVSITSPCPIDLAHAGMSLEQCGGSSLSYSRKYAISALLLFDDNKDPDSLPQKTLAEQVAGCTSIKQLLQLWQQLTPDEGTDETVKELFNRRKAQLGK